jgi:hypothetical protein
MLLCSFFICRYDENECISLQILVALAVLEFLGGGMSAESDLYLIRTYYAT